MKSLFFNNKKCLNDFFIDHDVKYSFLFAISIWLIIANPLYEFDANATIDSLGLIELFCWSFSCQEVGCFFSFIFLCLVSILKEP